MFSRFSRISKSWRYSAQNTTKLEFTAFTALIAGFLHWLLNDGVIVWSKRIKTQVFFYNGLKCGRCRIKSGVITNFASVIGLLIRKDNNIYTWLTLRNASLSCDFSLSKKNWRRISWIRFRWRGMFTLWYKDDGDIFSQPSHVCRINLIVTWV